MEDVSGEYDNSINSLIDAASVCMNKLNLVDKEEAVSCRSGYTLFQMSAWALLSEEEKDELVMVCYRLNKRKPSAVQDNRYVSSHLHQMSQVWSTLTIDQKQMWNTKLEGMVKKKKLPRWGSEIFISNKEISQKVNVSNSLKLSFRRYWRILENDIKVALNKRTTWTGYNKKTIRMPTIMKRNNLLVIKWHLQNTLFNLMFESQLKRFYFENTQSGIPCYHLQCPSDIDEIFTYNGRVASVLVRKDGSVSKMRAKVFYDDTSYGFVSKVDENIVHITVSGEQRVVVKKRSETDEIFPVVIKYNKNKQVMEIIFPRCTTRNEMLVTVESS